MDISVTDPHVGDEEKPRLARMSRQIIELFQSKPGNRMTNVELVAATGSYRYSARFHDIKKAYDGRVFFLILEHNHHTGETLYQMIGRP